MTTMRHILQVSNCQDATDQLCLNAIQMLIKSKPMRKRVSSVADKDKSREASTGGIIQECKSLVMGQGLRLRRAFGRTLMSPPGRTGCSVGSDPNLRSRVSIQAKMKTFKAWSYTVERLISFGYLR